MAKYVVRYGSMRQLALMNTRLEQLSRGQRVIARTNRGMEVGDVLCEASDDALSHLDEPASGQIMRLMSDEDENEMGHIQTRRDEIFKAVKKHVTELGLEMQLVDVEQLFGGERVIVYYLAEQRVDFRELVKRLASELQTRIEMRQIGVRDEAKLLADYGDCGKPVCCNTHLSKMPPVSMKMAKIQKATLDPNKISGRCGRLKCCLRYEYDTYEEIYKALPPIGSEILTRDGKCRVLNQEILSEQLLVESEDHRRRLVHASEVLTVVKRGSNSRSRGKRRPDRDSEGGQRGGDRRADSKSSDAAPQKNTESASEASAANAPSQERSVAGQADKSGEGKERRPSRGNSRRGKDARRNADGATASSPDSTSTTNAGSREETDQRESKTVESPTGSVPEQESTVDSASQRDGEASSASSGGKRRPNRNRRRGGKRPPRDNGGEDGAHGKSTDSSSTKSQSTKSPSADKDSKPAKPPSDSEATGSGTKPKPANPTSDSTERPAKDKPESQS